MASLLTAFAAALRSTLVGVATVLLLATLAAGALYFAPQIVEGTDSTCAAVAAQRMVASPPPPGLLGQAVAAATVAHDMATQYPGVPLSVACTLEWWLHG